MSDKNIDKWAGLIFGTVMIAFGSWLLGAALGVTDTYGFVAGIMIILAGNCYYQKWVRGGDE